MARSRCFPYATWPAVVALFVTMAISDCACSQERFKAPKIWDSKKLANWGLPRAYEGIHENYVSEEQYYSSTVYNDRTYPVYHPAMEPDGYWDWLLKQEPEALVQKGTARTRDEWVRLGRDVFDQLDQPFFRTDDADAFEFLRDREKFDEQKVTVANDGTLPQFRWVVEARGKLS